MKILKNSVLNGEGTIEMVPLVPDDLWFALHLIDRGDSVTTRKQAAEDVKLKLEVRVEEIADYDKVGSVLRVRGKNILENEHVEIGAVHTLELELNQPFVLEKNVWDSRALHVLKTITEISRVLNEESRRKEIVVNT